MWCIRVVVLASLFASGAASAMPQSIRVYESEQRAALTEGDATIATDPTTAYAIATDYMRWTRIFPSVRRAIVKSRCGDDARVTFEHFDGTREDLHFRNRPATHTMWFEQIGGRADVWAEIAFLPGEQPSTTHVHSRLYADVHGVSALFVSDGELRDLRQRQVRDDLVQLVAFFSHLR
jgi:hypothetical protein